MTTKCPEVCETLTTGLKSPQDASETKLSLFCRQAISQKLLVFPVVGRQWLHQGCPQILDESTHLWQQPIPSCCHLQPHKCSTRGRKWLAKMLEDLWRETFTSMMDWSICLLLLLPPTCSKENERLARSNLRLHKTASNNGDCYGGWIGIWKMTHYPSSVAWESAGTWEMTRSHSRCLMRRNPPLDVEYCQQWTVCMIPWDSSLQS